MVFQKVCFVSVSGGKDSTLCLALALEKYRETGTPVIPVFADTHWEHQLTYQYLDKLEEFFGIKIHRVEYKGGLPALLRKFKIFPSPRRRFCTRSCKTVPIYRFYERFYFHFPFKKAEVWYGLRRDESVARKKIEDWELPAGSKTRFGESFPFTIHFHYPIKNLTKEQVFRELKRRGIPLNPLYLTGHSRVGCYPCFLSQKDIKQVILSALKGDEVAQKRVSQLICWEREFGKTVNVDISIHALIEKAKKKHELSKRMLTLPFAEV